MLRNLQSLQRAFPKYHLTYLPLRCITTAKKTKDYYGILGLKHNASDKQVKEAYRELAKKYHPDVNTTGGFYEPSVEKFREVAEAYAVLSVKESRVDYDLTRRENPESVYQAEKMKIMEQHRNSRDKTGNVPQQPVTPSSYEIARKRELAEERKKYNVDSHGFYKGGLPKKGKGQIRGQALAPPLYFHDPGIHNYLNYNHPDAKKVTTEEAIEFKQYMNTDKYDFNRSVPWFPMYIDRDFNFAKERRFYLALLVGLMFLFWAKRKYIVESKRIHRYEREHLLEDEDPKHFINRGGVLLKKSFRGFRNYYENDAEFSEWLKMAYPVIFDKSEEAGEAPKILAAHH